MPSTLAVQTFTIRRDMKNPRAIAASCARLAQLGIGAIELAYIRWQPNIVDAVASAARSNGINVGSSQITYPLLRDQRETLLRFHQQLDCSITAVSVLPTRVIFGGEQRLLRFAEDLDALGAWYKARGLTLCFHHHDFEFRRYGNTMGLDLLLENTDPDHVALELDTYWTQRGGRTPQDQINAAAGRVRVVHLRDYGVTKSVLGVRPLDTALGDGNLDISAIIEACNSQGVSLMALEQATSTPWSQLERSLEYLRSTGHQDLLRSR